MRPGKRGARGVGGLIIISYSTNILHTFFRKSVGIYQTKLDNVRVTVFNIVPSEEHLRDF